MFQGAERWLDIVLSGGGIRAILSRSESQDATLLPTLFSIAQEHKKLFLRAVYNENFLFFIYVQLQNPSDRSRASSCGLNNPVIVNHRGAIDQRIILLLCARTDRTPKVTFPARNLGKLVLDMEAAQRTATTIGVASSRRCRSAASCQVFIGNGTIHQAADSLWLVRLS